MKKSFYKFRSNYERDIPLLIESRIYAPTRSELNDPSEGFIENQLIKQLQLFGEMAKETIQAASSVLEKRNTMGIFSLAYSWENTLLWSHYANAHKGFCVEYDIDYLMDFYINNVSKNAFAYPLYVRYLKSAPVVSIDDIGKTSVYEILAKIIGTKSSDWEYENEFRVLFERNGVLPVDYRSIKSITFGCDASEEDIKKAINSIPYNIDYYQISKNGYSLRREVIERKKNQIRLAAPDLSFLVIDDSDVEYFKYKSFIEKAVKIVSDEPYLESVFYAGIDRETLPNTVLIRINTNRDKAYSIWPLKFFFFKVNGKELIPMRYLENTKYYQLEIN